MSDFDCYNVTLPPYPTVGGQIYLYDIVGDFSDQLMSKIMMYSAMLFIYAVFNFFFIESIVSSQLEKGSIRYYAYRASNVAAFVAALILLVYSMIYYFKLEV